MRQTATRTTAQCKPWAAATFILDTTGQLSTYYNNAHKRCNITNKDITVAIKRAASVLDYPIAKGIPIERIDTHSLRSGGANALSLAGLSDTQIQKMGRWQGATFKEYVRKELASFSEGMSTKMKQKFHFVNVAGNSMYNVTETIIASEYNAHATPEHAAAA
jgi:hypothetical protein